jgi:hypothetical protein
VCVCVCYYSIFTTHSLLLICAVAIKIVDKMCARFDESLLKSEISTMMQARPHRRRALIEPYQSLDRALIEP